jgi:hypothetical protein
MPTQTPPAPPAAPMNPASERGNVTAGVLASAIVVLLTHAIRALFPDFGKSIDADVTAAFTTIVTFIISYYEPF